MRYFIFFLTLILTISCFDKKANKNSCINDTSNIISSSNLNNLDTIKIIDNKKIILKASLLRSFDSLDINKNTIKAFDVELTIINKSDKSICFWIMTCDWRNNFIVNNDYIYFLWDHVCDSNFPEKICIKPVDFIVYRTFLSKIVDTKGRRNQITKFGLILIDSTHCKNELEYRNIMDDKSMQNVILWSGPLYLNEIK